MKKIILILFTTLFIYSCSGKSTEECKGDIRAYEFGREMYSWVQLRSSGLSLSDAINEFSDGMGVNPPYESSDPCVKRGFEDAKEGIESPYNKEGKSWTKF